MPPGPSGSLDWAEVQVFGGWKLARGGDASAGLSLLRFQHGQPALAVLFHGQGRVGLNAMPLDASFSNFPAHPVFIPVLHGLMDYLAGGVSMPVNLPPAWSHDDTWRNPSFSHSPLAGGGLVGVYSSLRKKAEARVDLADPLGVDAPRGDRVDGDPLRAELARERLRPPDHAGTDGVREREVVDRLAHGARGDVDDSSRRGSARDTGGRAP